LIFFIFKKIIYMKKAFVLLTVAVLFYACEKETNKSPEAQAVPTSASPQKIDAIVVPGGSGDECTVTGNYSGTFTSDLNGGPNPHAYRFFANNYTSGSVSLSVPAFAFGGYRVTCDSIFMTLYNINNTVPTTYSMRGRLSNNTQTITGVYVDNNNAADKGTFNLNKQ
jgi:hypothetical protein